MASNIAMRPSLSHAYHMSGISLLFDSHDFTQEFTVRLIPWLVRHGMYLVLGALTLNSNTSVWAFKAEYASSTSYARRLLMSISSANAKNCDWRLTIIPVFLSRGVMSLLGTPSSATTVYAIVGFLEMCSHNFYIDCRSPNI